MAFCLPRKRCRAKIREAFARARTAFVVDTPLLCACGAYEPRHNPFDLCPRPSAANCASVFRQFSSDEARLLRRQFPQKCSESYLKFLAEAEPGECIGLLDRSYLLKFILLPSEELTLVLKDKQGDVTHGKHE